MQVRALHEGVRVWKLAEGRYAVPSSTQVGITYELTVHGDDVACNCPSVLYRGLCKYQAAVECLLRAEEMSE